MTPLTEKIVEAVKSELLNCYYKPGSNLNTPIENIDGYVFMGIVKCAIDKAIGEQVKQDNWISVEDERPTKYGKYLCYTKNNQRTIEIWNGTGWAYHHDIITHWQPLPNPPKTEADGK